MAENCYPRLRTDGQVTIPKDIRDVLELKEGERIKLTIETIDND